MRWHKRHQHRTAARRPRGAGRPGRAGWWLHRPHSGGMVGRRTHRRRRHHTRLRAGQHWRRLSVWRRHHGRRRARTRHGGLAGHQDGGGRRRVGRHQQIGHRRTSGRELGCGRHGHGRLRPSRGGIDGHLLAQSGRRHTEGRTRHHLGRRGHLARRKLLRRERVVGLHGGRSHGAAKGSRPRVLAHWLGLGDFLGFAAATGRHGVVVYGGSPTSFTLLSRRMRDGRNGLEPKGWMDSHGMNGPKGQ
mmetsp:Transcript_22222/g.54676  ORF Transcript_22222/g.54676 Transcript_22222/m.54676 type:complete len:246 (-) Transcript_22222:74-811(-)